MLRLARIVVLLTGIAFSAHGATYNVTNTADSGPGSLSQAVADANANPGHDLITFTIGSGPAVISSGTLNITEEVTIDGRTQPGYAGDPLIVIESNLAAIGFSVSATPPGFVDIWALALRDFGSAVFAQTPVRLRGNWIGAAGAENFNGVTLFPGASGSIIGGTTPLERNVISGNTNGINVQPTGPTGATNLTISGNYIGIDATGTTALPNSAAGIVTFFSEDVTIRGNVISGNDQGLSLFGTRITIAGNYIGTSASGLSAVPNRTGINMIASSSTIGGADPAARNVISGNTDIGLLIDAPSVEVTNNYIGVNAAGTAALSNGYAGVFVAQNSTNVDIGRAGAGNVISGTVQRVASDGGWGVVVSVAGPGIRVRGNRIGTDAAGVNPIPNVESGVLVAATPGTSIGGPDPGDGNRIENNGNHGVDTNAIGTLVEGNTIRNNDAAGVVVRPRIVLPQPTQNAIRRNSIDGNGALGIDLGLDGVTPNDPLDADDGPNGLQNFPQLTSASSGAQTTIGGSLSSTPLTTFTLEFFSSVAADPSGYGEGATFLGSTIVTTDAAGNASFTFTAPVFVTGGSVVTATATGPLGTSEFSTAAIVAAQALAPIPTISPVGLLVMAAALALAALLAAKHA